MGVSSLFNNALKIPGVWFDNPTMSDLGDDAKPLLIGVRLRRSRLP